MGGRRGEGSKSITGSVKKQKKRDKCNYSVPGERGLFRLGSLVCTVSSPMVNVGVSEGQSGFRSSRRL